MKNWLNNKVIEKEIDGQVVKFRRVPVGTLQKFRVLNQEVAKIMAVLFKDTTKDAEIEDIKSPSDKLDDTGAPFMTTSFTQKAAQASIVAMRATQLEDGIRGLLNTAMDEEALCVLCEVISKSAWEENMGTVEEIKENMDVATLIQYLQGAFEASAGDYTALGKSLFQSSPTIQAALEKMKV